MLFYYVQDENAKFFFSHFVLSSAPLQQIYSLILAALRAHPALPAGLKLQVFFSM